MRQRINKYNSRIIKKPRYFIVWYSGKNEKGTQNGSINVETKWQFVNREGAANWIASELELTSVLIFHVMEVTKFDFMEWNSLEENKI